MEGICSAAECNEPRVVEIIVVQVRTDTHIFPGPSTVENFDERFELTFGHCPEHANAVGTGLLEWLLMMGAARG